MITTLENKLVGIEPVNSSAPENTGHSIRCRAAMRHVREPAATRLRMGRAPRNPHSVRTWREEILWPLIRVPLRVNHIVRRSC
jgi:hypothetical protein